MLQYWKIILIVFYLQKQTLAVDNLNTPIDQMINDSIKASVRPCEDFYSHACGNYNEQTFFNASLDNKSLLDYANHQYNRAIINLLETYGRQQHQMGEHCQALTEKVRNYFESCRKVGKINLTRYLEEMKPAPDLNWPILENESNHKSKWPHDKDFDVLHLLGKLRSFGIKHILNVDEVTSTGFSINTYHSGLSAAVIERILQNVMPFMTLESRRKLFNEISETSRVMQDILNDNKLEHEYITYGTLIKRYPNLNFKSYFMEYMGTELPLYAHVILYSPSILQKLNDKIQLKFEKSKLCNYLMIYYLRKFEAMIEYDDMYCVKNVREMFNLAVNFLYYHHNTDSLEKLIKPDVTEIFKTVVDMLGKHVRSHEIKLTINQIQLLKDKLASIHLNIGDLPNNASCETIEKIYSSVPSMEKNNYYKNHLLMLRFILPRYFQAHIEPTGFANSQIYNPHSKTITLNYNYLMPPIYDFDYNSLGKYALLGFILAKRLLQHCNIVVVNDWRNSNYLRSAMECLIQQPYGSYSNIFDRVEDNVGSEILRKIVTLKFHNLQPMDAVASWKKHFFLNVAQQYCYTDNSKYGSRRANNLIRLNLIAMNSEGFAQAFNCPEDSQMNSSKKCQI